MVIDAFIVCDSIGDIEVDVMYLVCLEIFLIFYTGADKSLARPTSQFILFNVENISFDASLVLCIYTVYIYI